MVQEKVLTNSNYLNLSNEYRMKDKSFQCQYAPLYAQRLTHMRAQLQKTVSKKWPNLKVKQLVDLISGEKCIIIGTLYKEMKNKPNILFELAEKNENTIDTKPTGNNKQKYIDLLTDKLILEDELQRIVVCNNETMDTSRFCTGLVVALIGKENDDSEFEVEEYCYKETPLAIPKTIKNVKII
jgi:DNA polymerase delta subunit 2